MSTGARRGGGATPVALVAAGVAAVAAALVAGPLARLGGHADIRVPWVVFAAAFAASEVFLIHIETRRDAVSLSLSTIPLVIGLYTADPVMLVVARAAGSFVALALRRQVPLKLFVNLGHMTLEVAVTVLVFRSLVATGDFGPQSWGAAVVSTAAGDVVQTLVLVTAISLYQRRLEVDLGPSMVIGSVARLVDTGVALGFVSVMRAQPWALLLFTPMCVALVWAYRTHARLREKHTQLEHLHSFTQAMGAAMLQERTMESLLREAVDVLHADTAWLVVRDDGDAAARWVARGADGELEVDTRPSTTLGSTVEDIAGAEGVALLDAADDADLARLGVAQALVAALRTGRGPLGTLVVADRSGAVRRFGPDDVRMLAMIANQAGVALANGKLVDRLREQAAESEFQSLHDSLTGLPNRAMFLRAVEETIVANARPARPLAVLLLDLDGFKDVNDTLGHRHGDDLLRLVAARLRGALRHGDTIARLGGDEFAVLLPDVATPGAALGVARGLVASLEAPFAVADVSLDVGVSVGVAVTPDHGNDPVTLLQRADIAMYVAKEALTGAELYDVERDGHTPQRLAPVGELRQAITDGSLTVSYQPQVDLATGRVVGVEALVRWNHPVRGPVRPDEFVAVAERTGLIGPLTAFVLETAARDCARWRAAGGRRASRSTCPPGTSYSRRWSTTSSLCSGGPGYRPTRCASSSRRRR